MISTCKCTYQRLSILYGGSVCGEDKLTGDCVQRALTEANDRCYSSCRMQCFKKTYDYVAVHSTTIPFEEKNLDENEISILKSTFSNISKMRDNLIRLTVYYGSTERSVLSHRPKYEPIEVFSVIGGYTGFWLGVSFVAFLEWIERFLSRVSRRFRLKNERRSSPNCRFFRGRNSLVG
ncbi:epithelial sodium channel subunit beta-like [Tachypleus tridentatus]|uniref:epithelial sodium channel subunit beta-like n=1 Tax=Tachypleus tridentatus TaxID=6853 RepID=UPI003FCFAA02